MSLRRRAEGNVEVTMKDVKESLDLIGGAVKIVWPMGLPFFDPVKLELDNCEDLTGTQVTTSKRTLIINNYDVGKQNGN